MDLKPGEVIRWLGFDQGRDPKSEPKPFWFLVWGSYNEDPKYWILQRFTKQKDHFIPGGSRETHSHKKFYKKQYSWFLEECSILDFAEVPYSEFTDADLDRNVASIERPGKLSDHDIKESYNLLLKCKHPKKMMQFVHHSLNMNGITGIKNP